MPRLFVAVEIPEDVKSRLYRLRTDIPTARWVKPEHMHLTLRFIGADVPQDKVEPIKDALAQIDAESFALTLRGVGRFPPLRKPGDKSGARVLWAGIDDQPRLLTLHRQIESAVQRLGFKPDSRGFNPHLTLARLKAYKTPAEVPEFLANHADFQVEPFTITRFVLFNSTLSPQGPTYTHEAVYPLR